MRSGTEQGEGLRERKKRAMRQHISDVATRLFIARGFEQVTVDEVAVAADVSKMTVFNYFPRKEDLFFDRTDDVQQLLRDTLAGRGRQSPIAALRTLAHRLVEQMHPAAKVSRDVAASWRAVAESPALRARAFDLLDALERELARLLAVSVRGPADDPVARLLAATLLATWRIAFGDALDGQRTASAAAVRKAFRALLDRGFLAAGAAAKGSRYTRES